MFLLNLQLYIRFVYDITFTRLVETTLIIDAVQRYQMTYHVQRVLHRVAFYIHFVYTVSLPHGASKGAPKHTSANNASYAT